MLFKPSNKAMADIQAYFLFTNNHQIKKPITASKKKGNPIPKKEMNHQCLRIKIRSKAGQQKKEDNSAV